MQLIIRHEYDSKVETMVVGTQGSGLVHVCQRIYSLFIHFISCLRFLDETRSAG